MSTRPLNHRFPTTFRTEEGDFVLRSDPIVIQSHLKGPGRQTSQSRNPDHVRVTDERRKTGLIVCRETNYKPIEYLVRPRTGILLRQYYT